MEPGNFKSSDIMGLRRESWALPWDTGTPAGGWDDLLHAWRAVGHNLVTGIDEIISIRDLRNLDLYPHQLSVVRRVLGRMGGRAILADEVGLGKTIEAGLILKEYMLRGMVKRALILVPASLVNQWEQELERKLNIDVEVAVGRGNWNADLILASLDMAKKPENQLEIAKHAYDLVIVDEAHRLKESSTLNWRFVNSIRKRFLLLLTATPVQNELKELYNMVTLLRPGQLRTFTHFKREFMLDKRTPKNPVELKNLLAPVLIRHTRRETGIPFPDRFITNIGGTPTGTEAKCHQLALQFVRANYHRALVEQGEEPRKLNILPLVLLLREVCSSPRAAAQTALHMLELPPDPVEGAQYTALDLLGELHGLLGIMHGTSKLESLLSCLKAWEGEKALVFTEFAETAVFLADALQGMGVDTTLFHGGLTKDGKSKAIGEFRDRSRVMVSTEAGGEGHNLQFCRNVVNYDLPWNPMRIEQRIGRVHRLGQTKDVRVANIYLNGTVESYVLYLLDTKIRMFETIVGELDLILAGLGKKTFEGRLSDLIMSARDEGELQLMVEALGDQLEEARDSYERTKHMNAIILDQAQDR